MKKHVEPGTARLQPSADRAPPGITPGIAPGNTGDETRIDWPAALVPSAALAMMTWGGAPVPPSEAVSELTRPSGVVVQVWCDALVLGSRKLTPTLTFDDGRLVRVEVADLRASEVSTLAPGRDSLGYTTDTTEGIVAGNAGVTRWVVDLIDGRLSLEPDPELTEAG